MHTIGFNAMKALGMNANALNYAKKRLTNAKTSVSLRLNAFLILAKTTLDALKRVISR